MLGRLLEIVGPRGLISDGAAMRPWLTDWRNRKEGQALAVVLPASVEEVAAVLRLAAAAGQPVFPLGGNTGLCFGAVPDSGQPDRPGIVVSLQRLNRIRQIDQASDLMTVDAGVILAEVHAAAAGAGRQFPLHLGSEGSAQIGGLISTNAGGTAVLRYGPMRDLVAGLEVVLPDGRVFNDLGGLRKNNTGYQLRQLFVGAEGTLGIITGATLRLHPKTVRSASAWLALAGPEQAVELLARFRELVGSCIEAFELLSDGQVELVRRHIAGVRMPFAAIPVWSLMVELASTDSHADLDALLQQILEQGLAAGLIEDAVVAASQQQAADIWRVRHSVSEANKKAGIGITHDIAVRPAVAADFIRAADVEVAARHPQASTLVVCHLGDGNVHYIVMFAHPYWAALPDPDAFALEVERTIHDVGARFGGTFSAEHGVGRKLPEELARLGDPLHSELMHGVKRLFDPHNRMNPGVLLLP